MRFDGDNADDQMVISAILTGASVIDWAKVIITCGAVPIRCLLEEDDSRVRGRLDVAQMLLRRLLDEHEFATPGQETADELPTNPEYVPNVP